MTTVLDSLSKLDSSPTTSLHASPADWRDQFIYFLLVDRFDNNVADIPAYQPVASSTARQAGAGHHFKGGDLEGVTRRLFKQRIVA